MIAHAKEKNHFVAHFASLRTKAKCADHCGRKRKEISHENHPFNNPDWRIIRHSDWDSDVPKSAQTLGVFLMCADVMLVTGASSGIGRACAERFFDQDWKVYGTSRTIVSVDDLRFEKLTMDVDDDESVKKGVDCIVDREGQLDAVVYCAGFGIAGAVEDTSITEAKAQFETNFFGAVRVCRSVLPIMRQQRSGILIMVSSLGGLAAIPFQAFYSASKFALEGLTEALRMEVKPFGIRVVLVEPGNFSTGFTASRQRTAASSTNLAYRERCETSVAKMEHDEVNGADPVHIARLVERIVNNPSPKLRYAVGPLEERAGASLKRIVPYRLYESVAMRYYGINS